MALNNWQKLTRVLPGRPFGDGRDGTYSSATIPTMTYQSCSGTSGQADLTIASGAFSNGDVVLIHQTRGTGAGQWEINRISSGGGTTTLTMKENLQYTYTDSGASQAQVIKIPMYTTCEIPSGTWTVTAWNGNVGGILPIAARVSMTVTGAITASNKGFRGGASNNNSGTIANSGEGTAGASVTSSSSANGNGGGGGRQTTPVPGGGGNGGAGGGTNGGSTAGSSDLVTMVFGGGGGGEGIDAPSGSATSGAGGGIVMLIAKQITITGSISDVGQNAVVTGSGTAGSGAGGSILIQSQSATLGTTLATATGGTTSSTGGTGRIALHYSGSYTGSTNPSLNATNDLTLIENWGGQLV